ncbi:MAG: MBL fold metallo-hydrolase [Burkholderiales bacterium]|nr:MBL fold metallo-hydrolase [Burkholderiales bacterium]MDE2158868.1 MBL fold metallo-hydrolase [Burkholderiales bacterium]
MEARADPAVRHAASLLLLRDGAAGLEVLMLRRAERAGDLRSGAAVFPGGVLDARDRLAHGCCVGGDDAHWSAALGLAAGGLDYLVAALRETYEEVGLLLADAAFDAAALHPWRARLAAGETGIADLCRGAGLRLDLRGLVYYSHWLTPPGLPRRFDTRFFAARAPAGQEAQADRGEAQELMWLAPGEALDPARGLKLLPVTRHTLQFLARHASADAALAAIRSQPRPTLTLPRRARTVRGPTLLLPTDPAYAEVARLDPEGDGLAWSDLVAGRAVRLSTRVIRVTAPNPGMMTGPGTNSYLVGGGERWTVIDPGPDDAGHVRALIAAAPGRIERILVTHTHIDHAPAARALAQATGAELLGRSAPAGEAQDASFVSARELADGERLQAAPGATLRAIHTPGHASNHLCYLLEEERLLFTGDHVMQGSTVVINPPDGDMAAYLSSLARLQREALAWLAPGHGWLVADPQALVAGLIAHRLRREARVAAALQAVGPATLAGLVPRVYDDVPPARHGVAARSLLAHLLKLEGEGRARRDGEVWRAA